jgi:hypothetical protein
MYLFYLYFNLFRYVHKCYLTTDCKIVNQVNRLHNDEKLIEFIFN